jgi:2-polyprenyl-3-methyl-5-hydroxy-6-metoxy-1,4-benzoquinol methylase
MTATAASKLDQGRSGQERLDQESVAEEAAHISVIPTPSCWLCGQTGKQLYSGLVDWLFGVPGSWGLRACANCGVAWQDPQPSPEDIPKLYARYYTHHATGETALAGFRRATYQWVMYRMGYRVGTPKGILPRLVSYAPPVAAAAALEVLDLASSPVGTLLDVGCGNGDFIARMQSFGWRVSGVDPDPTAVARARSLGLEAFSGAITDVPATNQYDAITLSHVIEHVPDPVGLLRECRRRLRPGTGILVMTTPNIKSLGHWWFRGYWRGLEMPRHLILFSPSSLSECVARSGLVVRTVRTETRLARMIYAPSACARSGDREVGGRSTFSPGTRYASYAFQLLEDLLMPFKKDVGEEIYCVCTAPAETDGNDK